MHSYGRNNCIGSIVVKIKRMRALLFDLQCRQEQETQINSARVWVDNTAALAVATGNGFTVAHETVKHVAVKDRFLQECVRLKILLLAYIKKKHCRHHDQTIYWTSVCTTSRQCKMGMLYVVNIVSAAAAEIWRRIRIRV